MTLRLYVDAFWISPYTFSAVVALTELGVAFDVTELALQSGEQKRGDYKRRSFTGRIPALDDGGFWLSESSAIVEYLADTHASPVYPALLPTTPRERARARMVMAFCRSDLAALREERPTSTMFYERASRPLSAAGEAAAARLLSFATELVPPGATSLFGGWSVADADLAFMLQRLGLNGHPLPASLAGFVDTQWSRPSVQAFVARRRPAYVPY